MTVSEKLRECPFCGRTDMDVGEYDFIEYVSCECGARCHGYHDDQAVKRWNTRHEPKHETVEEWEKRTGEAYPDEKLVIVWDCNVNRCISMTHGEDKETSSPLDNPMESVVFENPYPEVANHHGKPEEV
jgi:hypothetical protein